MTTRLLSIIFLLMSFSNGVLADQLPFSFAENKSSNNSRWCEQMAKHMQSIKQKQQECHRLQNNITASDRASGNAFSADLNCRGFDNQLHEVSLALIDNGC